MENKGILTKFLAMSGTILVWLPILAPILLTAILFTQERRFLFDYLMPAELALLVLTGGFLLIWAALRAHSNRRLLGWSLGVAVVFLLGILVIPDVTGLASGETEPGGWQWILVLGSLIVYSAAVVATGIGGILLLRDVFKPHQTSAPVH
jgi:hypothetical protein